MEKDARTAILALFSGPVRHPSAYVSLFRSYRALASSSVKASRVVFLTGSRVHGFRQNSVVKQQTTILRPWDFGAMLNKNR